MKNKKTHMKRMLMLSLLTGACCFHSMQQQMSLF